MLRDPRRRAEPGLGETGGYGVRGEGVAVEPGVAAEVVRVEVVSVIVVEVGDRQPTARTQGGQHGGEDGARVLDVVQHQRAVHQVVRAGSRLGGQVEGDEVEAVCVVAGGQAEGGDLTHPRRRVGERHVAEAVGQLPGHQAGPAPVVERGHGAAERDGRRDRRRDGPRTLNLGVVVVGGGEFVEVGWHGRHCGRADAGGAPPGLPRRPGGVDSVRPPCRDRVECSSGGGRHRLGL